MYDNIYNVESQIYSGSQIITGDTDFADYFSFLNRGLSRITQISLIIAFCIGQLFSQMTVRFSRVNL